MKQLLSLILLCLCLQPVQAETVEMKPENSIEEVEVQETFEDFDLEKEALKKFMQASPYLFEEEAYHDLDAIDTKERFDLFQKEVEEKESLFVSEQKAKAQIIQSRLEKVLQKLKETAFVEQDSLVDAYRQFEEKYQIEGDKVSNISELEEFEKKSLEEIAAWEEHELNKAQEKKTKFEKKYLALLQEKVDELAAFKGFVDSDKALSEEAMSEIMIEAEEKLQEAMDEKQMETIVEDFIDNFDDDFDLNAIVEEFLSDEDVQSLIDWGLINQDELEAYFFDILENYEDYLDLGMTLRELFERRMASLEAMRALYEQKEVLPATGVSSPLFYALALVLVGFALWYRSMRK